jgi:hypothetical protein
LEIDAALVGVAKLVPLTLSSPPVWQIEQYGQRSA